MMLNTFLWASTLAAFGTMVKMKEFFNNRQFLLFAGEDEDIKIADGTFRPKGAEDLGEAAAKDFLHQKEIGNIVKARELGAAYADTLWLMAQELLMSEDEQIPQLEKHHQLLLCSYLVNRAIAEYSPNSIVAQTALNTFYTSVEEKSEILHLHVSDTATYSLYILNERTGGGARHIGEIFARQCGKEGDLLKISEGEQIFEEKYAQYLDMAKQAGYEAED